MESSENQRKEIIAVIVLLAENEAKQVYLSTIDNHDIVAEKEKEKTIAVKAFNKDEFSLQLWRKKTGG